MIQQLFGFCLLLTGVLLIYVGVRMWRVCLFKLTTDNSTFWVERKLSKVIICLWLTYIMMDIFY